MPSVFSATLTLAQELPKPLNMMREIRDESARTGEPVRWFAYTIALLFPWIALGIIGPWPALVLSALAALFWLWWVQPPVGLNRRPGTWLVTLFLLFSCGAAALLAVELLQHPSA